MHDRCLFAPLLTRKFTQQNNNSIRHEARSWWQWHKENPQAYKENHGRNKELPCRETHIKHPKHLLQGKNTRWIYLRLRSTTLSHSVIQIPKLSQKAETIGLIHHETSWKLWRAADLPASAILNVQIHGVARTEPCCWPGLRYSEATLHTFQGASHDLQHLEALVWTWGAPDHRPQENGGAKPRPAED